MLGVGGQLSLPRLALERRRRWVPRPRRGVRCLSRCLEHRVVDEPERGRPPRRVRGALNRKRRRRWGVLIVDARASWRHGRTGRLLELRRRIRRGRGRRGSRPTRRRGHVAERARVRASAVSLVEHSARVFSPAPPPLLLLVPRLPHTLRALGLPTATDACVFQLGFNQRYDRTSSSTVKPSLPSTRHGRSLPRDR